jgi:hypothetical protein
VQSPDHGGRVQFVEASEPEVLLITTDILITGLVSLPPNLVWLKIDDLGDHFPLLGSMPCLVTAFVRLGSESLDYCEKPE